MADTKITALTAITTVDPAVDVLPIVDVSDTTMAASGTTKKITSNQLLGAGGTATLAAATITGDLTVRTNKLVVTSTGVAIGATSASYPLDVTGDTRIIGDAYLFSTTAGAAVSKSLIFGSAANVSAAAIYGQTATSNSGILYFATETGGVMTDRLSIGADGVFTFQNVGGVAGTAMTLNSTGLGVGVVPTTSAKIHTLGNGNNVYAVFQNGDTLAASKTSQIWLSNGPSFLGANNREYRIVNSGTSATASDLVFDYWNGTAISERMRIDSSGNLLVGTPTNTNSSRVFARGTGGATTLAIQSSTGDTANPGLLIGKFDNNSTTSQILVRFTINDNAAGSGQITANGANAAAFGTFSDSRLKENIASIPSQLEKIVSLRPVEFDFKNGSGHQIGFVAQEMQDVYPDVVGEQDGFLTVTGWSKTEARLVSAIKELAAKVQALEAKLA